MQISKSGVVAGFFAATLTQGAAQSFLESSASQENTPITTSASEEILASATPINVAVALAAIGTLYIFKRVIFADDEFNRLRQTVIKLNSELCEELAVERTEKPVGEAALAEMRQLQASPFYVLSEAELVERIEGITAESTYDWFSRYGITRIYNLNLALSVKWNQEIHLLSIYLTAFKIHRLNFENPGFTNKALSLHPLHQLTLPAIITITKKRILEKVKKIKEEEEDTSNISFDLFEYFIYLQILSFGGPDKESTFLKKLVASCPASISKNPFEKRVLSKDIQAFWVRR